MSKCNPRPAAAAFFLMVTMSLLSTALAFFVEPVCADLGFGRGSFTLYYSLMVAAGAVSTSILGAYMNKHGVRGVILVSAFWVAAGGLPFPFPPPCGCSIWQALPWASLAPPVCVFGSQCHRSAFLPQQRCSCDPGCGHDRLRHRRRGLEHGVPQTD